MRFYCCCFFTQIKLFELINEKITYIEKTSLTKPTFLPTSQADKGLGGRFCSTTSFSFVFFVFARADDGLLPTTDKSLTFFSLSFLLGDVVIVGFVLVISDADRER